jgi:hypothetical protein
VPIAGVGTYSITVVARALVRFAGDLVIVGPGDFAGRSGLWRVVERGQDARSGHG